MYQLELNVLCEEIERQKFQWLEDLRQIVSFKTIPFQKGQHHAAMVQWLSKKLCQLNAIVEILESGADENKYEHYTRPKLILAHIKHKHAKETLLIYGHIDTCDVTALHQAENHHEMNKHPFKMSHVDGKLYGHGLAHGKGPLMCWLHAIEALSITNQKLSVSIKFVIETSRTAKSEQLEELMQMRKRFFQNIDYVCLLEQTAIIVNELPVICNAISGTVKFIVELQQQQPAKQPQSARQTNREPLHELAHLIDALTNENGSLLLSKRAQQRHTADAGDNVIHSKRLPQLTMSSVKGVFPNVSMPKLTPTLVTGKFSVDFSPAYDDGFIVDYVVAKLTKLYKKCAGENALMVTAKDLIRPWVLKTSDNLNFKAIERALAMGGNNAILLSASSKPHFVAHVLREFTKCDALIFNLFSPKGKSDELEHIEETSYWHAVKELAVYLTILGEGVKPPSNSTKAE